MLLLWRREAGVFVRAGSSLRGGREAGLRRVVAGLLEGEAALHAMREVEQPRVCSQSRRVFGGERDGAGGERTVGVGVAKEGRKTAVQFDEQVEELYGAPSLTGVGLGRADGERPLGIVGREPRRLVSPTLCFTALFGVWSRGLQPAVAALWVGPLFGDVYPEDSHAQEPLGSHLHLLEAVCGVGVQRRASLGSVHDLLLAVDALHVLEC